MARGGTGRGHRGGALGPALVACALAAVLAASGCGGPDRAGARFTPDDAVVLVQSNVPEAELWIDDRFVGQVGSLAGGVALSPGRHRIEVRHTLYHTYYEELAVQAREQVPLDALLVPVLP